MKKLLIILLFITGCEIVVNLAPWHAEIEEPETSANHPLLVGDVVYYTTRDKNRTGNDYLYKIEAKTGMILNKVQLSSPHGVCLPTVVGDYIYTVGWDDSNDEGTIEKINLNTFQIEWVVNKYTTGAEMFAADNDFLYVPLSDRIAKIRQSDGAEVASYSVSLYRTGYSSGTILVNGLIYYRKQDGYLAALNPSTMNLNWQVSLQRHCEKSYSSPMWTGIYMIVADCSIDREHGSMYAIDITTHQIVWQYNTNDGCFPSRLNYTNGKVIAGRYSPRPLAQNGVYMAFNVYTGGILWESERTASAWHVPSYTDKYIVNYDYYYRGLYSDGSSHRGEGGKFMLLDIETGDLVFSKVYTNFYGTCGIGLIYNSLYIRVGDYGVKSFNIIEDEGVNVFFNEKTQF
jgi:outer membrane protein assembly factor BamB